MRRATTTRCSARSTRALKSQPSRAREARDLLVRSMVSIGVALGIMVLMLVGRAMPMEQLNLLALVPATFVQLWAGGRFYRAAWRAARHGAANMDTLIAVGTTAAWGYSTVITLAPQVVMAAGLEPAAYFDSSTLIIGFVLLGRWLEARAKGQAGGAIRRLLALEPPVARRIEGDREVGRAARRRPSRATSSGSGRAIACRSMASWSRAPRRSTGRCSPASRCPSRSAPATRSSAGP